jgi:prepilin-type N-terminal cleavage/methylation domain-containing protein
MRSTPDLTARPGRRPGFTLIELLVVVALIGILASLAISGVMKLRAAQLKRFTETAVDKLASALDQSWKASLDDIKQEDPGLTRLSGVGIISGGDQRRARVIYLKMRMKSRYPTNFTEAVSPDPTNQLVPPEAVFLRELTGVSAAAVPADVQSSILLFLTLTQARRGMAAFNPSEMDPTTITTFNVPLTNGQFKTMSYFRDAWDNPIRLYTFPTGNDELQGAPYVNPATAPLARDPLDPEGTLYAADWRTAQNGQLAAQFELRVHRLRKLGQPAAYLQPVVASAGPDGQFGVDPVNMTSVNADLLGDNIYSYRLRRAGARGD